jgi:hypothetical protein
MWKFVSTKSITVFFSPYIPVKHIHGSLKKCVSASKKALNMDPTTPKYSLCPVTVAQQRVAVYETLSVRWFWDSTPSWY